jgi:YebC/PmpR family DNA-binding regulatory protein
MSGHSKWSQIKHQKGVTDAKKSQAFSKLARMISVAARKGENPEMNSELRMAVEKAKSVNIPSDNIERAIKRGAGKLEGAAQLESARYEAHGPSGVAMIINIITDNRNRSISEIKHILSLHGAKLSEPGSVLWAFEYKNGKWEPKNTLELGENDAQSLNKLLEALDEHDDVQEIYTNAL